jgi:hypothetical protein
MPSLIVDQSDRRTGGPIVGRVLIGRLPTNGVVVEESTVSRLHAWIDLDRHGQYFVGDSGSLGGTHVNGRAVTKRRGLEDGDVILIGRAHIVFSHDELPPPGVTPIDLAGLPPNENVEEAGVLFDCVCGAPVWFKAAAIGQAHVCRHCGATILIPDRSGAVAQTVQAAVIAEPGVPPSKELPSVTLDTSPHSAPGSEPNQEFREDRGDAVSSDEDNGLFDADAYESVDGLEGHAAQEQEYNDGNSGNGNGFQTTGFSQRSGELRPDTDAASIRPSLFQNRAPVRMIESPAPGAREEPAIVPIAELTAAVRTETCSICRHAMAAAEATTACPSCGLTFHVDCWKENFGCSAYGCDQVNVLKPADAENEADAPVSPPLTIPTAEEDADAEGFPWEFLFLAMSVVGSLLGALAYGVPPLIGAGGTAIYLAGFKPSRRRRGIAVISLLVCLLGIAGGVYLSYLFWNGWPIGRAVARGGRP